jgi:hypothetical protein
VSGHIRNIGWHWRHERKNIRKKILDHVNTVKLKNGDSLNNYISGHRSVSSQREIQKRLINLHEGNSQNKDFKCQATVYTKREKTCATESSYRTTLQSLENDCHLKPDNFSVQKSWIEHGLQDVVFMQLYHRESTINNVDRKFISKTCQLSSQLQMVRLDNYRKKCVPLFKMCWWIDNLLLKTSIWLQ